MAQVRIVIGGRDVAQFLQDRWPPAGRSIRNVPRFHPDVTLANADDRLIKELFVNRETGEESWLGPWLDPASSATFIVRVPDEVDIIETIRAACRLLDGVTNGLVREAAALAIEIDPQR